MHDISKQLIECFNKGNKVLIVGNGGSAAMAQHMAAELVGKMTLERRALPAIALTCDTSILTAIGNDYGFENVFRRQVEALGRQGDILVTLSTSGKSKNVLLAVEEAYRKKMVVIDFERLGNSTAGVQEFQLKLMHEVCEEVERFFWEQEYI